MECTIRIEMDNSAFERAPSRELARILSELAYTLTHHGVEAGVPIKARDSNGNTVGALQVSP